tara:strand:- start:1917 stop:2960 length:1044 start_codon:yes stop_codon:yes gene_type:complete
MKSRILYFLCFLLLICQPAYAIKVSGLYQAIISVSDQSESKRRIALKQALGKVLIKVTGNRNINKSMGVNSLLERSEQFVQQYRYYQNSNEWGQKKFAYELRVQFDENAIDEVLKNQGFTVWDKERPSVLVWLVSQKNNNRSFVNIEKNFDFINILEERASARGISLLFPLLDLQDDSTISVTDVWGGFSEPILEASKRYQANVILTGKFTQILPTLWESEWSVYFDKQVVNWVNQSDVADIVLEEGIDELIDHLVSYYSDTRQQDTQVIELLVNDIENIDQYAQTFSYLNSLQYVNKIMVKEVTTQHVIFELTSNRGIDSLDQAISLGKILESIEGSNKLEYRLLP